ncbi:hypothetical protein BpHYR1_027153 [Brachionus plicatilis]|uniref:Uncharacterized protein n=1 Tax=Brachionus plicatilis TaxID=10195 RepID=A0A3M7QG88_BRAPC|nr:hypothetical protein BpHYR1_027153 [Brachionus plicatilis]
MITCLVISDLVISQDHIVVMIPLITSFGEQLFTKIYLKIIRVLFSNFSDEKNKFCMLWILFSGIASMDKKVAEKECSLKKINDIKKNLKLYKS